MKKILYGICGIGLGHSARQLPIIEHLAQSCRVVIFAYGKSLEFYQQVFNGHAEVKVLEVAVPFWVGHDTGLDFSATAQHPTNQRDFSTINFAAMAAAQAFIGQPDLVVSDYEPVSAQYAYAYNAPLMTFDQQSKYLARHYFPPIQGHHCQDEVARLKMFFPQAKLRLACSFFKVQPEDGAVAVDLCPPSLRPAVKNMVRLPAIQTTLLIYLSSQQAHEQSLASILEVCAGFPEIRFEIFSHQRPTLVTQPANVTCHNHGSARFDEALACCTGIISTAGHTLLSEAMYLGIPVYALPLGLYEQQMNAAIIAQHGFGVAAAKLDPETLARFIYNLPHYRKNILQDKEVLLRGDGAMLVIQQINKLLT